MTPVGWPGMPERWVKQSSGWFREGVAGTGGIVLPGRPAGRGADLFVRFDGIELRAGGVAARLPWERFRSPWPPGRWRVPSRVVGAQHVGWPFPVCPEDIDADDGWTFGSYGWLGVNPGGIAVVACGPSARIVEPVRLATDSRWNRARGPGGGGGAVPLWADAPRQPEWRPELDVLAALGTALAGRPALRVALARRDVGARLLAEMAEGLRVTVYPGPFLTPSTRAVLDALGRTGLRHPIGGRPLPGDPLPDEASVVGAVLADCRAALGHDLAPRIVTGVVQRYHLGVAPWPFATLVAAAARPGPPAP